MNLNKWLAQNDFYWKKKRNLQTILKTGPSTHYNVSMILYFVF